MIFYKQSWYCIKDDLIHDTVNNTHKNIFDAKFYRLLSCYI